LFNGGHVAIWESIMTGWEFLEDSGAPIPVPFPLPKNYNYYFDNCHMFALRGYTTAWLVSALPIPKSGFNYF
jgi:hypothetical protein